MKIALVTHRLIKGDGQGRINYEIVQHALREGHEFSLLASEIEPELRSHPSVQEVRIEVDGWPTTLLRNQIFAWRSFRWLKKHGYKFDVLHANGFITWAEADVNVANFVHSSWLRSSVHTARVRRGFYGAYQWLYTALNALLERRAFHQSKMVVPYSGKTHREILELGIPDNRIRYIPVGVDSQEFYPRLVDRKELNLPEGVPLALFAGDMQVPRKNLDSVLHAMIEVPEMHLAAVGSAKGSPYPGLVEQLELTSRVHFLGYRQDLPQLMRAADLFVFPSRYEPFGLVVLEAMASGLPVVTASTTGAADVVNEECGIIIDDPENTKDLAIALEWLTQHPETRKKMGIAARITAEQHSWEQMSDRYLALYCEIGQNRLENSE